MSESVGSIHYDLGLDTSKFDKQAQKLGDSIGSMGKKLVLGTAAITAAVVGFGVVAVKAYGEAEASQKQLEHAVLNVTHATKEQLKQTSDLADALEKKGVLDGDNIKMGLAQLSTFGLSNKAVQGLGSSLSDLAVNQFGVNASGEQLTDTANMIAKALNGQFGVLEKSGIRFTDAQKHMIEYGTEMQKVDAINQGFAQNLKYTNDVALQTTEGKIAKLKVSFDNIKESIGKVIVDALTPLLTQLSTFVSSDKFQAWLTQVNQWLAVNIPLAIAWVKDVGIPFLVAAFETMKPVLMWLFAAFSELITWLKDNTWALWAIVAVFTAIKVAMFLHGALQAFQTVMMGAGIAYRGLAGLIASPLALPAIAVAAAIASLYEVYNAVRAVQGAIRDVNNAARAANSLANEGQMRELQQQAAAARARGDTAAVNRYANAIRAAGGNALGTNDWKGGLTWVGEKGPELVNLPHHSQVIPNNKVDKVGGGSTVINLQMDGIMARSRSDLRDIAKDMIHAINEELTASGKMGIAI